MTLAAYPLVPRDEVGFRVQVTAANTDAEIEQLVDVLGRLANSFDLQPVQQRERAGGLMRALCGTGATLRGPGTSAVTGVLAALYLFVPPFKGSGLSINVLGFFGVVAIVAGIRIHRPKARAAWWLFVVGQFLFFSGDLYTYTYPEPRRTSASRRSATPSTWRSTRR